LRRARAGPAEPCERERHVGPYPHGNLVRVGGAMPKSRRPRPKTPITLTPISGPDSFGDLSDPHHVHSQAAALLLIGSSLRGDLATVRPGFAAMAAPVPQVAKRIPDDDLQSLGFPAVRVSGQRFHTSELRQLAGARTSRKALRTAPAGVAPVAEAFYK